MMRWIFRAFLTITAATLIGVGLWEANSWSYARWMAALGIAGGLLTISWFPTTSKSMPIFNRTLLRWSTILAVIFLLVTVQLVRIQIVEGEDIATRTTIAPNGEISQNPRRSTTNEDVHRGSILARNGDVLVESVQNDAGDYERVYHELSAANVLGYYSPLLYGVTGLESAFNDYLVGQEGGNPLEEWLDGLLHRGRRGYDVKLTLDDELQRQAVDLLGDRAGGIVLMEAHSGNVLTMASTPGFDPNLLSIEPGATPDTELDAANTAWDALTEDPNAPLLLRPTQGLYVPGSTFKMVTASTALDTGNATVDSIYRDEGALVVDGRVILGLNRPDESKIDWTLTESFAYSLNVVFAQIGLGLGPETLWGYAGRYGFGEPIPFVLPVEPSQLATSREALQERTLLADTGFGQGQLLVTPLQMAMITAAIANDGEMMQPRIATEVIDGDGEVIERFDEESWQRPISSATAEQMQELMEQSATYGYASGAQIAGLTVGGKTGTAETGSGEAHSWFTGYVVDGDNTYVVAVIVEHGGSGSEAALPIGRALMETAASQGD